MTDYIELHAASAFSFLNGAAMPEDLARRAAELGYPAMALVDANGVYGAPRFYKAAKAAGVRAIVGADVDIGGKALTLLVSSQQGYRNLCRLLTEAAAGREKNDPLVSWDNLQRHCEGLYALSRSTILIHQLRPLFPGRLYIELQRHYDRAEEARNRAMIELSRTLELPLVATNGVRYLHPEDKDLYDVLCCIRLGKTLENAGRLLEPHHERYLKSAAEMAALFADVPEALRNSVDLADKLQFTLADLGYRFPDFALPAGETPDTWLRTLAWEGARRRFPEVTPRVREQMERELALIAKLGLAGYFLTIWDIVEYCRRENIIVQGRGSAANSAVCYALSITAVDPIKMDLLFERFLSEERGEWPDIDLDLPSGEQREKVIQHLYRKHGGGCSAMTANVITYRPRSAMREAAKVLGYPPERIDELSKWAAHVEAEESTIALPPKIGRDSIGPSQDAFEGNLVRGTPQELSTRTPRTAAGCRPPFAERKEELLLSMWRRMLGLPRHLGQHSGGMVIAGGRLDDIVPLEPASMPGRVVIQWDKDDCADLGLIKVDLLGLGMLAALEKALPLIRDKEGVHVDLARLPPDDKAVYDTLNKADTVGLFQLESRAQMASLPRNAPRVFYDIVVQVAIIRPGPIVGGMIRPFFDRRAGKAPVVYPHPSLEPVLKRTLGVPLFQEQVLRIAMIAAGFTGGQAEELRRAMGFTRSPEKMNRIQENLEKGMIAKGIDAKAREQITQMVTCFALYGFPESHAASFALIAYASAYIKVHHPAAFYVALLNSWPMGFYHPATLVKDAQRHGLEVLPIDVSLSGKDCRWVSKTGFRLGLRFVKGLSLASAERIEAEQARALFRDSQDLSKRAGLREDELELLAYAGALGSLGLTRRGSMWQAAQVARHPGPLFDGEALETASPLPEMAPQEETLADYRSSHITVGPHLMEHYREELRGRGVRTAAELSRARNGARVRTAGSVIVRQRPATAKGFVFITLEDESGLTQAIVSPSLFKRQRDMIVSAPALIVEGQLQKEEGNLSVKAARLWPFGSDAAPSHDFH